MEDYEVVEAMKTNGVIAIIRGTTLEEMLESVQALYDGGIRIVEVTFNTEGAEDLLKILCHHFKGKMIIGAGTILDETSARIAILAGAQFILSPSLHPAVMEMAHRYGILAVPGVMTPTEAIHAWELGAQLIKVFPAGCLSPQYIKQLLGPLHQLSIMVVGGIGDLNLTDYLEAGACCAGIGGDLVDLQVVKEQGFDEIRARAEHFCALFKEGTERRNK